MVLCQIAYAWLSAWRVTVRERIVGAATVCGDWNAGRNGVGRRIGEAIHFGHGAPGSS